MMPAADPETVSWVRIGAASGTVLGLLALLSLGLKYVSTKGISLPIKNGKPRRLQLVESLTIDPKHRMVIIRRDDREHLLLLGTAGYIVIEANLSDSPQAAVSPREP